MPNKVVSLIGCNKGHILRTECHGQVVCVPSLYVGGHGLYLGQSLTTLLT
jgi:hypothetical protein